MSGYKLKWIDTNEYRARAYVDRRPGLYAIDMQKMRPEDRSELDRYTSKSQRLVAGRCCQHEHIMHARDHRPM